MLGASHHYKANQSNNQSGSTLLNNSLLYYRNDHLGPYKAVGFNIDLIVLLHLHLPLLITFLAIHSSGIKI